MKNPIDKMKGGIWKSMGFQDEETALHCAASRGHIECVQSLLDAGASVDATDQVNPILIPGFHMPTCFCIIKDPFIRGSL